MSRRANGSTAGNAPPPAAPKPEPRLTQEARSERRARLRRRLTQLADRGLITAAWFTEFHVRVRSTERPGEMFDFWPSTSAWRVVGSGQMGDHGWPKLMRALGLQEHITVDDTRDPP